MGVLDCSRAERFPLPPKVGIRINKGSRVIGSPGLIVPTFYLFADDLDEDTVRKTLATQKMNGTVPDKASQHLTLRWS